MEAAEKSEPVFVVCYSDNFIISEMVINFNMHNLAIKGVEVLRNPSDTDVSELEKAEIEDQSNCKKEAKIK